MAADFISQLRFFARPDGSVLMRTGLAGCFLLCFLCGCRAGPKNFENENDRLRAQVMDLKEQLVTETDKAEGYARLIESHQQATHQDLPKGVIVPACSAIALDGYTDGVDSDGDGQTDLVRLYLLPQDPDGRFIQVVASVAASVVAITPGQEATTVATFQMNPSDFHKAYRSGLTGTHYTLEIPLGASKRSLPEGIEALTLRVKLTDLATGLTHETQKEIRVIGY